jgi:hypothetical protein
MGLPTGFAYNTWVTLEMQLIPSSFEFLYRVGDLVTATTGLSGNASDRIGNVALQGHNTNDGVTYTIYWDNFRSSSVPADIWYADDDSDGFGNSADTIVSCTQPLGYVADNTDCDDSDANEFPGQTWYIDADGDDYGASSATACLRPANGYLLSELLGTGTDDCDDSNASVNPAVVWYADVDGDGYGDPLDTTASCTQPSGYVANSSDCDDTNGNVNPLSVWWIDTDGDGYGDDATVFNGCTPPLGYALSIFGPDCLDSNSEVYPGAPATQDGLDNNCDGIVSEQEECLCLGDYNLDGQINVSDILVLLGSYGCTGNCPTDLSGDNEVDTADLLIFLPMFGSACPVYIEGQGCVIPD